MSIASTSVCMCHCISLHVYNNSTRYLDSGAGNMVWLSTEVQLIKAVCTAQEQRVGFTTSRTKKNHRNLFFSGRSQQRDCVRQQPCSSRPLIHLCDHDSSHFLRVPLSAEPPVFSERVSHLSHCTSHLTRYSLRPTNSPHKDLQCIQDFFVALPRIGECSHCSSLRLILVLSILFVTSHRILISVQHQGVPWPQPSQSVNR